MMEGKGSPSFWRLLGIGYLMVGLGFITLSIVNTISAVEAPFYTWATLLLGISFGGCARLAWWRATQRERLDCLPPPPLHVH